MEGTVTISLKDYHMMLESKKYLDELNSKIKSLYAELEDCVIVYEKSVEKLIAEHIGVYYGVDMNHEEMKFLYHDYEAVKEYEPKDNIKESDKAYISCENCTHSKPRKEDCPYNNCKDYSHWTADHTTQRYDEMVLPAIGTDRDYDLVLEYNGKTDKFEALDHKNQKKVVRG